MDRVDALRIFTQVADMTSYTRAATALRMPKATVSLAVQRLEDDLGARLFHRTTRVVRLTQEGEQLYERARGVLADFEELTGLFRTRELVGRVRVDMTAGIARRVLIPRLASFHALHPRVEIELLAQDRFADPQREGIDLVVRLGPLTDSSLTVRSIGSVRIANFVSATYVARYGVPLTLDDLDRHLVIGYATPNDPEPAAFEWIDGDTIRTKPMRSIVTVASTESYRDACYAGLGLMQAPSYAYAHDVDSGLLFEVLPQHQAQPRPLSVLHPHGRKLSRRARAVLEHIEPALHELCAS